MDLKTLTDEELIEMRKKLDAWLVKHQSSKWGNRFWQFTALAGAYAVIDGLFNSIQSGVTAPNAFEMALGFIIMFSWYRGDKRIKSNTSLLKSVNDEISLRGESTQPDSQDVTG
ncbi:MAG: hypothetical protein JW384_00800 [Nitrosomonadaceae bacterium]|nr:hypothetical protein [Nitrosospira sp.]MBI0413637.1 hypothetical protein [Nitrosospira sp.]MCG3769671.1 hypothetical protein [Nitrosomonadaceae bacterium]